MEEIKGGLSEERITEIMAHMGNFGTLRELKGISNAEIETIYGLGVDFYRAGNYKDAEKIFRFLTVYEHTSSKYWTAMGSVQQIGGRFEEATKSYAMATLFDLHNPKPMYYAAECFMKMGDSENARKALASLEAYGEKDTENGRRFQAKGAELKAKLEAEAK